MEIFIYSDVKKESCRERIEPKSTRDVNNKSYRDRIQPRLIQDGEIPVPLCGTLDNVQCKMNKWVCATFSVHLLMKYFKYSFFYIEFYLTSIQFESLIIPKSRL